LYEQQWQTEHEQESETCAEFADNKVNKTKITNQK